MLFLEAPASRQNTPWLWMKDLILYVWIWTKTPFPCWLLAVSLHCLNSASGACVQSSEQLVLAAQGQLGNTQPEFHELHSLPRPRGRARGEQCSVCSADPAFWTPWGVRDGFASSTYKWKLVKVKHPICVLMRFLCIFNLKFLNVLQHLCVLNSSLSYRWLVTVLKYSIF